MNGHDKIIQLRMAGEMPSCVFIDDFKTAPSKWAQEDDFIIVCVEGDSMKTLDLRFLIGLDVRITANKKSRANEIFDACVSNGAKTVAAYSEGVMFIYNNGETKIF